MAECKWCSRSGWFLAVDSFGLCGHCSSLIALDVRQRMRIVGDSAKIVDESKNLETRLSRLALLLEHANALCKYEQRGIPVLNPPASALIEKCQGKREQIISEGLRAIVEEAERKSAAATTVQSRITPLSKALLKIREYAEKVDDRSSLTSTEKGVMDNIHRIQLDGYLDQARKAEFKGQKKKALDQYYEALYFLKHDDIDDSLQQESIAQIEAKIAELGGEVK